MQKFIKTNTRERATYTYKDAYGKKVVTLVAGEEGVTAEDIKRLHLEDDREVRNNLKNSKPKLEEKENTQYENNWNLSLEKMVMEGGIENTALLAHYSISPEDGASQEIEELQEAMTCLNCKQQLLLQKIYFEKKTATEIAHLEGVSKMAIHYRLEVIYKKIKKFYRGDFTFHKK